jgi:hypothetical protein
MLVRFYDPQPWAGRDIFIISGTARADKKVEMPHPLQRRLGIPGSNIFSSYSETTLAGIYKRVQERRSTDRKARSLLILDDVTSNSSPPHRTGAF